MALITHNVLFPFAVTTSENVNFDLDPLKTVLDCHEDAI
jgi:hypothetical protein